MINFEIIIDDAFSAINTDNTLTPIENKKILSIINNFENGYWNHAKFHKFIWNHIKETALSFREREALALEGEDSVLTAAAINLRLSEKENDIGRGSEIAEIVLYGIMKNYYNALPIVPKIFYKQNSQDNAKGSDSVHIVIEADTFSLWLGESKFYDSIENTRLDAIIQSVKDSLDLKKLRKENSIITNLSDIKDFKGISETMRTKIINSLSQNNSIDDIKPILNVPIFLLHQCKITSSTSHMTQKYKEEILEYHKNRANEYFKKQIKKCSMDVDLYSEIKFHIILFPVPEKKKIVDKFIEKANIYRS